MGIYLKKSYKKVVSLKDREFDFFYGRFYIIGLISILYQASESPFYMALLPCLNMAGRMISSSFAPLLFNHYRFKQLLIISQILKTALLLILSLWSLYTLSLYFIFIIIFTVAFLDGLAHPASNESIP